ncbi:MAG: NADH-quinone oxidoreductase subunit C [Polyangia bacterium]
MKEEEVCAALKSRFGDGVSALGGDRGDKFVVVKDADLVAVCRFLKETSELAFDYCQDITAVDWPSRSTIEVVVHLHSLVHRHGLVLKVETKRDKPELATLEGVWRAATWLEREVYDMFGVRFLGHSDLRRILLPDDWVGYPLRKDYQEAGGFHGIENVRPDPLVQLGRTTEAERKRVAATAVPAATAPVDAAAGVPAVTAVTTPVAPSDKREG